MPTGFADLLKLAEYDYKAVVAMERFFPDEYAVRTAAYLLQQAVEKILKAAVLYCGEIPPFTHDIARLAEQCSRLGMSFDEELDPIADTLTLWESKCRFDPYVVLTHEKYHMAKQAYDEVWKKLDHKMRYADIDMDMDSQYRPDSDRE